MIQLRQDSRGFTLIEMLVIAPIVILAIGAFLAVIISMTGEVIATRASNTMVYNVQDALDRIEEDVKQAAGFLPTNIGLVANSAQGYNDDGTSFTNVGGASGTSLILNMVATRQNPLETDYNYVYLRDQPDPCSDPHNNIPLTYNIVYFVKNDTLWRRTIMPANYNNTTSTVCATPWQQPSCSPNYMEATASPPFCQTSDIKLVEGVAAGNFAVDYFINSAATSPNATATSTSASQSARATALAEATSIRVTINANQQAGGRDISNTSSLRVSRTDPNAAMISAMGSTSTPSSPSLTMTPQPGARAQITWDPVPGAGGYTLQYNFNGGSWQTAFSNQNTRDYTISAPANQDTINVRVLAVNPSGSSSYATTSYATPLWENLQLQNGWVYYGGYSTPQYTKTRSGAVVIKGMIKRGSGTAPAGEIVATLPEGYRPDGGKLIFGMSSSNDSGRVDVTEAGAIAFMYGNSTDWISIDTIRFIPAGAPYTRTNIPSGSFSNGWASYGGDHAAPSYVQAGNNRVFVQGLGRAGTMADNTRIFTLPSAQNPSQYLHIASRSSSWADIGVDPANGIVAKNRGSSYLSLNANFLNASYSGWSNASLQNGWVTYSSSFSTPQYTKTSDGLVSLKGLIRAGTASSNTTLFTLPAGYRPDNRAILTTASNGAYARLDIMPDGRVFFMYGSNSWFSLDGITFVGEQ
ncbi:hypothetical protein CMN23_02680 [Candidatus Saccharibacteria bacterium]|nr:hypothetical protein [Candidatus Saccharibacteria bacterium]